MSKIILPLYVVTATLALVLLKLGTSSGMPISYVDGKLNFHMNIHTLAGFAVYGISFVVYMYLIAKNDLGYIIPLAASFVYILLFTASYFVFNEQFSVLKLGGIALIMVGIVLLNLGK